MNHTHTNPFCCLACCSNAGQMEINPPVFSFFQFEAASAKLRRAATGSRWSLNELY